MRTIHSLNFESVQKEAFEILNQFSLPSSLDESWRKINLNLISLKKFDFLKSSLKSTIENYNLPYENNKNFLKYLYINFLNKLAEPYKFPVDFFTVQNIAFLQSFNIILIPENQKQRVLINHYPEKGNSFSFFTLIYLEKSSELEIVETIIGQEEESFWNTTTLIFCEENSRIRYTSVRNHKDLEFHFHKLRIIQKKDSYVETYIFHNGGILGKGFVQSRLMEKNIEYKGYGFFFGEKGHFHNMEMDIFHFDDFENSSLLYKSIVKDRATSVFTGKLETLPKIKKVNSYQLNQNLILSKKAKIESMPWLIVKSEDVSCEHGSTSGELDEESIFYLQTRGLSYQEAVRTLIIGFIYELLENSSLDNNQKENYINEIINKI